ncbi:MAG: phage tail tube protein [Cetobacterium sp.]
MTAARIGYGSKFLVSQDGGLNFTEIAEVNNITPPSNELDLIDATHMQSPNRTREFIAGLNDPGECEFEMNFVPGSGSDVKIQEIVNSGVAVRCKIVFPNTVSWAFDGVCIGYTPEIPTDDKMMATVTFKVTGSTVAGIN